MVNYQQGLIFAQKNDHEKGGPTVIWEAIQGCPWEEEARYQIGHDLFPLGKK
jgi:hypothetical protein